VLELVELMGIEPYSACLALERLVPRGIEVEH
jgi:hypothetical protein